MDKNSLNKPSDSSADSADLEPEFLLKLISAQIGQLEAELPGIISDAILAPPSQEAMRKSPNTALNFRLNRPLQYYLRTGNKLSADKVLELREKIQKFKDGIPSMREQALLASSEGDPETAEVLEEVLASLSSQLDGIISSLYQSLTV